MKTFLPEKVNKSPEEKIGIAKIKIMFEDSFGMFNANSGNMSHTQKEVEKDKATNWIRSKGCEFFCDLAGTEQDHIIKLHDQLTYQYNTGNITLEEVRFAIRKLELKI
mgnify:FL=1|jgi:hypothetical protein|tara:strand:- start:971 stop:1294 length:324 start_codon:yes stop_codon:yes gene_type:complete